MISPVCVQVAIRIALAACVIGVAALLRTGMIDREAVSIFVAFSVAYAAAMFDCSAMIDDAFNEMEISVIRSPETGDEKKES